MNSEVVGRLCSNNSIYAMKTEYFDIKDKSLRHKLAKEIVACYFHCNIENITLSKGLEGYGTYVSISHYSLRSSYIYNYSICTNKV